MTMPAEKSKRGKKAIFSHGVELGAFLKKHRPDLHERQKNPTPKMRLAQNLYRLRTKLGLTQAQLAKLAGVGVSTYQRIEEAQPIANPKMDVIEKLAEALKVDLPDLWKTIHL